MAIPRSVPSLLGPVEVIQSAETDRSLSKEDARGTFSLYDRTIRVSRKMPEVAQQQTLGHEVCHVVLEDSGLSHMVDPKLEEALCDAFGVWFAHAMQTGKLIILD